MSKDYPIPLPFLIIMREQSDEVTECTIAMLQSLAGRSVTASLPAFLMCFAMTLKKIAKDERLTLFSPALLNSADEFIKSVYSDEEHHLDELIKIDKNDNYR